MGAVRIGDIAGYGPIAAVAEDAEIVQAIERLDLEAKVRGVFLDVFRLGADRGEIACAWRPTGLTWHGAPKHGDIAKRAAPADPLREDRVWVGPAEQGDKIAGIARDASGRYATSGIAADDSGIVERRVSEDRPTDRGSLTRAQLICSDASRSRRASSSIGQYEAVGRRDAACRG